jgi:hypothetical protein
MLRTVKEHSAANISNTGSRKELNSYLDARLEKTGDIVGWWGVSIPILPWNVVLMWHRIT